MLGLTRDASLAEIRAAYRILVRRYHPDMSLGHPVEQFHAVHAAWEVLRDEGRRRRHLAELGGPRPNAPDPAHIRSPFDPMNEADMERLVINLDLPRDLAAAGGAILVRLPVTTTCPDCADTPFARIGCPVCDGGVITLTVRASLVVPPGIRYGERTRLDCHLELFGHRQVWASVRVVG